jgi:pyruvate/2-oxoglutarate/acetoin dehydrogenase E1 component
MRQAIAETLREHMLADPTIVVLGEDVGRHGGSFQVTAGLQEEFGSRLGCSTCRSVRQASSGWRSVRR